MRYIDDIYPFSVIDFLKYREYVKLRKERDKFLKSLREMSHIDWSIDKRLVEAGGLGKTVYILPARGGSSFQTLRRVEELTEEGRDVQFVTTLKKYEPKLTRDDVGRFKKSIVTDWDLCPISWYALGGHEFMDELYGKKIDSFETRYLQEPYEFEPSWTVDPYGHVRLREVSLVRRQHDNVPR
jgi:hypothetical protein